MNRVHLAFAGVLASGVVLTGCTTMGGNIKGSFACSAPDGICAPSSTIDDRALAMISGDDGDRTISPAGPYSAPAQSQGFDASTVTAARSEERVLRVVFPSQIDAAGRLHEQTAVHAVVEQGGWQRAVAGNPVATTPQQVAAATGGDTLLAAVERADPPVTGDTDVDPDMPTAAAVAAARAQADPVGDIKDQVARRLAKRPARLPVDGSSISASTAVTYRPTTAKAAPVAASPTSTASQSNRNSSAPKAAQSTPAGRPTAALSSGIIIPARATPAGRAAIASVAANPAINAGRSRVEAEARDAGRSANVSPVLRASSFPGVD